MVFAVRRVLLPLGIVFLGNIVSMHVAIAGDVLTDLKLDIDALTKELDRGAEEQEAIEKRFREELGDAILPVEEAQEERDGTRPTLREEREAQFLTLRIDGQEVILRDVPRDAWFSPYVRFVAEQNIVSGYRDSEGKTKGLFGPGDNITVEQLSKIAVLSSGVLPSQCPQMALNQTASGSLWSQPYLACAERAGWVLYSDGSIPVSRLATREEVLITLLQAFQVSVDPVAGESVSPFTDVSPSTQFYGAILRAKTDGIVSGYSDEQGNLLGTFGPQDPITRAEAAKILTLALQRYRH